MPTPRRALAEDKRFRRNLIAKQISRRRFLAQSAAAGALAAAWPATTGAAVSWLRTLFFNFSHLSSNQAVVLVVGGRSYPLTRTIDNPAVLARAKGSNRFLAAIPDSFITHHVQGVTVASDICTLAYAHQVIDQNAGTWQMVNVLQMIPDLAHTGAYGRMRAIAPDGPMPHSAKRKKYGLPAAITLQEVLEEQVLIDSTDHARTLIALQPDLLSAEPVSAAVIKNKYVESNIGTTILSDRIESLGPAQPESVSTGGWATLRPLNQDDGQPFQMPDGRNQYFTDLNSDPASGIGGLIANSVRILHPAIKNDTSFGMDVTGVVVPPDEPSNDFSGKLWLRHDGVAGVSHSLSAALDDTPAGPQLKQVNGQMGLVLSQPGVTNNADGSVTLTLNNFSNWFLRFLGMYIQFVGPDGNVIPLSSLTRSDIFPAGQPLQSLDLADAFFSGILPPAFSVAGIPVAPGGYSITVKLPATASTLRVFFGGIGGNGARIATAPAQAETLGIALTAAINYGLVDLFMCIGVTGIGAAVALVIGVIGQAAAQEILVGLQENLDGSKTDFGKVGLAFLKALLNGFAGKGLSKVVGLIFGYVTEATASQMIPVVGLIASVVAAVIGAVQLVETSIEVGISPPVYEFDITRSHDVTVTILPDGNWPLPEIGYTLYYKVNYLFDDASPHYLDAVTVNTPYPNPQIIVSLNNIPQGGEINVSVGFYVRQNGQDISPNDFCAAKGTTGLQDNLLTNAFTITIENVKIPITSTTLYTHQAVTNLDSAGNHQWLITADAPAYTPPSGGQQPGSLGALRSISVRQSTPQQTGYIGYSWQGYSSGLLDCSANAPGQLDQAANLNSDPAHAQNGYANTPCGQQGGANSGMKLSYSLLSDDGMNFFLDTNNLYIRQVSLSNPPAFSNPATGNAFGKLNMSSTALLLHPAGHLVSINDTFHKMEVLKLPATAQSDPDAQNNYLARAVSGQGSRPGLIHKPAALAVSPEGVILVLEDSAQNNRIQAFDVGGNPISYFTKQTTPYFLQLDATQGATYLDLAVEFSGFLYVLAQGADGVFRLDIYHPGQSGTQPISTTRNINGAKLCVDFWRSVYTLNYQVLQLSNGQYPGLTEPSVSLWMPTYPTA
ncbi:MAG TPA: hypothetical protein VK513_00135 [Terriglobales bacterium]|nr:hypothetical protein [Terriglobales bacterium]